MKSKSRRIREEIGLPFQDLPVKSQEKVLKDVKTKIVDDMLMDEVPSKLEEFLATNGVQNPAVVCDVKEDGVSAVLFNGIMPADVVRSILKDEIEQKYLDLINGVEIKGIRNESYPTYSGEITFNREALKKVDDRMQSYLAKITLDMKQMANRMIDQNTSDRVVRDLANSKSYDEGGNAQ